MDQAIPLDSRHVRLRPPKAVFVEQLYQLAATGMIPWQWRGSGETPEGFRNSFWSGVLAQFAIEDRRSSRSVGLVNVYDANLFHGYAYLSFMLLPDYRRRIWPLDGLILFINYVFTKYNIRNLYAESPEATYNLYGSGEGNVFEVMARLPGHLIVNGLEQDLILLRITRQWWRDMGRRLLTHCTQIGPSISA